MQRPRLCALAALLLVNVAACAPEIGPTDLRDSTATLADATGAAPAARLDLRDPAVAAAVETRLYASGFDPDAWPALYGALWGESVRGAPVVIHDLAVYDADGALIAYRPFDEGQDDVTLEGALSDMEALQGVVDRLTLNFDGTAVKANHSLFRSSETVPCIASQDWIGPACGWGGEPDMVKGPKNPRF